MSTIFEWDEVKAKQNLQKYGVSFDELRYVSIGVPDRGRILVIVHVDRNDRTRLISCRKATFREQKLYEQ